jgi:hypothetical protein
MKTWLYRTPVALLSIGWYLMVPPDLAHTSWSCALSRGNQWWKEHCVCVPDPSAPLSQWRDVEPFDELHLCQAAAEGEHAAANIMHQKDYARCIATDDPRLAK